MILMNKRSFIILVVLLVAATKEVAYSETLYNADTYRAVASDRRAYRVGDVLTVLIVENSTASATAGTRTDKGNDVGVKFSSPNSQKNYSLNLDENFDGGGKIARSGKLLAQISVVVKSINDNGDFDVNWRSGY